MYTSRLQEEDEFADDMRRYVSQFTEFFTDQEKLDWFGEHALRAVCVGFAPSIKSNYIATVEACAADVLTSILKLSDVLSFTKKDGRLPLFAPAGFRIAKGEKRHRRGQENVWSVDLIVLDYDKGDAPLEAVAQRLIELGLAGLVQRSPSDGTTEHKVLIGSGEIGQHRYKSFREPTREVIAEHLRDSGYAVDIVENFVIVDPAHIERERNSYRKKGVWTTVERVKTYCKIKTPPIAKTRLFLPLPKQVKRRPDENAADFNNRVVQDYMRPIAMTLGFAADESCFDASRLFFVPTSAMPSQAEEVTRWVSGEWLDPDGERIKTMRAECTEPIKKVERATKARRESRKTERIKIGRSAVDRVQYRIADAIVELAPHMVVRDRREAKNGMVDIECPYAEMHSNDPNGCGASNGGNAWCFHDSCRDEFSPADHVDKMIADGWFTTQQLARFQKRRKRRRSQAHVPDAKVSREQLEKLVRRVQR